MQPTAPVAGFFDYVHDVVSSIEAGRLTRFPVAFWESGGMFSSDIVGVEVDSPLCFPSEAHAITVQNFLQTALFQSFPERHADALSAVYAFETMVRGSQAKIVYRGPEEGLHRVQSSKPFIEDVQNMFRGTLNPKFDQCFDDPPKIYIGPIGEDFDLALFQAVLSCLMQFHIGPGTYDNDDFLSLDILDVGSSFYYCFDQAAFLSLFATHKNFSPLVAARPSGQCAPVSAGQPGAYLQ